MGSRRLHVWKRQAGRIRRKRAGKTVLSRPPHVRAGRRDRFGDRCRPRLVQPTRGAPPARALGRASVGTRGRPRPRPGTNGRAAAGDRGRPRLRAASSAAPLARVQAERRSLRATGGGRFARRGLHFRAVRRDRIATGGGLGWCLLDSELRKFRTFMILQDFSFLVKFRNLS